VRQGPAFSSEVTSLQSELRLLKQAHAQLTVDHKAAGDTIRKQEKQLQADQARLQTAARTTDRLHVRRAGRVEASWWRQPCACARMARSLTCTCVVSARTCCCCCC
jgi:chromosome segregation ATPase